MLASLLVQIEKKIPSISGKGKLVRGEQQEIVTEEFEGDGEIKSHAAMLLVICVLLAGIILASFNSLHFFAWLTIIAVLLNLSQLITLNMRVSLRKLSGWGVKAFFAPVLVAFGLTADFDVIIALFSLANLSVIISIVVGAALGAGITSHFVKLYPLEKAYITPDKNSKKNNSKAIKITALTRAILATVSTNNCSEIGTANVSKLIAML